MPPSRKALRALGEGPSTVELGEGGFGRGAVSLARRGNGWRLARQHEPRSRGDWPCPRSCVGLPAQAEKLADAAGYQSMDVGASVFIAGAIVIGMNVELGEEMGRSMAGLLGFVGRSFIASAGRVAAGTRGALSLLVGAGCASGLKSVSA